MDSLRWFPLLNSLRSVPNIVLVVVGLTFTLDLLAGSPLASQLVLLQLKLMHIDPSRGTLTIMTFFGTLNSVDQFARIQDKFFAVFGFGLAGISFLMGLLASIFRK